jgi:hypothetical protein
VDYFLFADNSDFTFEVNAEGDHDGDVFAERC